MYIWSRFIFMHYYFFLQNSVRSLSGFSHLSYVCKILIFHEILDAVLLLLTGLLLG
jgi:hypothetical protein